MRRRPAPASFDGEIPDRLAVFDAADWPTPPDGWPDDGGDEGWQRFYWRRAQREWCWQQGLDWPAVFGRPR